MTKYVLPIFNKEGQENISHFDVDRLLAQYGFGCTHHIYDIDGHKKSYSTGSRSGIEAQFFDEEEGIMSISNSFTTVRESLAALLVFNEVSEAIYTRIESDVGSGKF